MRKYPKYSRRCKYYTSEPSFRAMVEAVFDLGGGELEPVRRPWGRGTNTRRLWYEGAPDYAERECQKLAENAGLGRYADLRTAIEDRMHGNRPPPKGWTEVAAFRTSGETSCPECGSGTGNEHERAQCGLCEGSGIVYIGDGWHEVVYAKREPK